MTPEALKALATIIENGVGQIEAIKGPQPRLRHALHVAQALTEQIMELPADSLQPDGGGGKPHQ